MYVKITKNRFKLGVMKKLPQLSEKFIENSILDYLAMNDIFAWKVKTVGTYDPKLQRFRMSSKRYMRGVADILGIYQGKPLAIEVKTLKGIVSPHQKLFLNRFHENGGIAILARSLDDVIKRLESSSLTPT